MGPEEAKVLCDKGAILIDVRLDYMTDFKKFDVSNVVYFPKNLGPVSASHLDNEQVYIVAESSTSVYSREVVKTMIDAGLDKVYNLAGGIVEWERSGLPVLVNNKARLSGGCACSLRYNGK